MSREKCGTLYLILSCPKATHSIDKSRKTYACSVAKMKTKLLSYPLSIGYYAIPFTENVSGLPPCASKACSSLPNFHPARS